MKTAIRTLALTIVVTGIAAGAYSSKTSVAPKVGPDTMPIPTCPLNTSGCGIWK